MRMAVCREVDDDFKNDRFWFELPLNLCFDLLPFGPSDQFSDECGKKNAMLEWPM